MDGVTPPYSDTECILDLEIRDSEIPILLCQVIQDGTVLSHPELTQRRPVPAMERDPDLHLIVPVGSVTDPNLPLDSAHVLAPLFQKASLQEEALMVGNPS